METEKKIIELKSVKNKEVKRLISGYAEIKAKIRNLEELAQNDLTLINEKIIDLEFDSIIGEDLEYGKFVFSKSTRVTTNYDKSVEKKIKELKESAEKEGKVSYTSKEVLSLRFLKQDKDVND